MGRASGSPTSPPSRRVLEVIESPLFVGSNPRALLRGADIGATTDIPFYSGVNGNFAYVNAGNGVRAWKCATTGDSMSSLYAAWLTVPLDRRPQVVPVIPSDRPLYRHLYECVAWSENAGAGATPFGVGLLHQASTLGYDGGGGTMGYELTSLPTLNGGRWTVRRRLTVGGAVQNVYDSGISALIPRTIAFEFVDSRTAPKLSIWLDGVWIFSTNDPADMPVVAADDSQRRFSPTATCGINPGSESNRYCWIANSRYLLDEL